MFYLKLLNRSAFRKKPLRTLILGVKLLFLIMFKLRSRFILKFGSASFKFEFKDEGKHKGGRGIFIFRENIEDLMLYGDQFIKHGDVCIDVGANQGLYTLAFSSIVGSSGTVMSIEPQKYAIDKINSFIHLNKFKKPIIINAALSNKEGEAVLDVTKGSGYASIVRDFGQKKTLKVNTITLDKIINDYDLTKLNFIKMDIEGAELNALKGSEFSLKKFKPTICLECEPDRFGNINEYLSRLGYKPYIFNEKSVLTLIDILPSNKNCVFFIWDITIVKNFSSIY